MLESGPRHFGVAGGQYKVADIDVSDRDARHRMQQNEVYLAATSRLCRYYHDRRDLEAGIERLDTVAQRRKRRRRPHPTHDTPVASRPIDHQRSTTRENFSPRERKRAIAD